MSQVRDFFFEAFPNSVYQNSLIKAIDEENICQPSTKTNKETNLSKLGFLLDIPTNLSEPYILIMLQQIYVFIKVTNCSTFPAVDCESLELVVYTVNMQNFETLSPTKW